MENTGAILFLYAESPLHAGSGTGLGAVDLPIQRERMSHLPMIQGSGIKGALRERLEPKGDDDPTAETWRAVFGPRPPKAGEGDAANEHASALSLVDGRLLLFPVRTVWGGWAWVTSPMVLQRLARDLEILEIAREEITKAASVPGGGDADDRIIVTTKSTVSRDGRILLEDFDYAAVPDQAVDALATWLSKHAVPDTEGYKPFAARLSGQLAVVSDAELRFLTEHATEVVARTRIDPDTGTVQTGALWTEESLPAETLLWSTALFSDGRRKGGSPKAAELQAQFVKKARAQHRIRLGGDRTVGRGLVGLRVLDGSKAPSAAARRGGGQ
jgi:CRISPR-associated protein Cmr4